VSGPLCRYCGKPIAKQTTTHYVYEEQPSHAGGDYVVGVFCSKAEVQRISNEQVLSVRYHGPHSSSPDTIWMFTTWDGESYASQYFCNGEHARLFGYAAAKSSIGGTTIAMPAYWDALKKRSAAA